MSLLGLLSLGSNALTAQSAGIAVTGRNTANVATEGYSREAVDFQAELAAPLVGGVRSGGLYRTSDPLLGKNERDASGAASYKGSLSTALHDLETTLTPSGNTIPDQLANLFGGLSQLAGEPLDPYLRRSLVTDGEQVARSFRDAAAAISSAQDDSDHRIRSMVSDASALTTQIANANKRLAVNPDPVLADQRDLAARKLAELVGGEARIDSDGKMRFVAAGGVVLVDGDRAASLRAVPDATMGNHVRVEAVDGNHVDQLTNSLTGGKLAAELEFRDKETVAVGQSIDQLAFDFATSWNTIHRGNAALDGTTGRDFFTLTATATGAAASLQVNAAIVADPSLIAAATPGTGPSNGQGAHDLLALRDSLSAAGGTASVLTQGITILAGVGSSARSADTDLEIEKQRLEVLANARDSVSGVSTEEEMAKLAAFQHAHEATLNFISTVNSLMSDLIDKL